MEVLHRKVIGPDDPREGWGAPNPHTELLPKGSVHGEDAIPLRCDILMDRDSSCTLRDGKRLYMDVFRPQGGEKVPAIICWSPYGKDFHRQPFRWYSPFHKLSNLQKFEALDPEYWVAQGYAIVNPDARGAFNSEGDIRCFGEGEGQDIHDLVEWLATQSWCSGKVAMAGNSWLTMSQYWGACQQPAHLAAIAPWEGFSDIYRDLICRGGIPDPDFFQWSVNGFHSRNRAEDVPGMLNRYPLFNEYWQSKIAPAEKIRVPAYFTASFTNLLHVRGTFHNFCFAGTEDKWLRVHNSHEWTDIYDYTEDLRKFFDHYLKGLDNGWEQTPRVRMSVLDPGGQDTVDRPENEFPLARTVYKKLYLDGQSGKLVENNPAQASFVYYDSEAPEDAVQFVHTFEEETELTGYFKAKLWVSAESARDMDIFVYAQKLDANGNLAAPTVYGAPYSTPLGKPHMGSHGRLRVSLRALDTEKTTEIIPFHPYTTPEPLEQGEVVPIEIGLWPYGLKFHKGQKLRLIIAGAPIQPPEFLELPPFPVGLNNHGRHLIHTGGVYDSYLQVPYIPEK